MNKGATNVKTKVKTGQWTILKNKETKRLTFTSDSSGEVSFQGSAPSYVDDGDILAFMLKNLKVDIGDRVRLSNGETFSYGITTKTIAKA